MVVELLVLELLRTDFHDTSFKTAFPGHELRCQSALGIHRTQTALLISPSTSGYRPESTKASQHVGGHAIICGTDLVHQRHALITSLHEIVLRRNDDLAREVIQREEQARHGQTDEARDAEQGIQEDSTDNELDG